MSAVKDSQNEPPQRGQSPFEALQFEDDGASSGIFVRLLIAPAATALLLASGVYWLRMQPPSGSGIHEQATSTVMVSLIPRPDPAPIPIPIPSPIAANSVAALGPPSHDEKDEEPVAVPPEPAGVKSQETPASAVQSSATAMPPSKTAIQFQQALERYIARYLRYPSAARRNHLHLQGTVQTFFSIRRDGTLIDVWVGTSSGQPVLDQEAIETVRRAQPLPPIPQELPNRLNVQISLGFDPF